MLCVYSAEDKQQGLVYIAPLLSVGHNEVMEREDSEARGPNLQKLTRERNVLGKLRKQP
jgi:hypothetical protein